MKIEKHDYRVKARAEKKEYKKIELNLSKKERKENHIQKKENKN
jgi:hypothetical protein